MASCKKCGKSITKGVKFCPSCGAAVGSAKATKSSAKPARQTGTSAPSASQNRDYKTFGGWLLVFYWCAIIGGILWVVTSLAGLLAVISTRTAYAGVYSILGRYGYGGYTSRYFISALVNIASAGIASLLFIRSVIQMKARDSRFFDTLTLGMLISCGGSVVASLLSSGVTGFISSIIFTAIGFAIGMALTIMYFQRSVRVKVYFGGRPLHDSKYWDKIARLPDFIISEKPLW